MQVWAPYTRYGVKAISRGMIFFFIAERIYRSFTVNLSISDALPTTPENRRHHIHPFVNKLFVSLQCLRMIMLKKFMAEISFVFHFYVTIWGFRKRYRYEDYCLINIYFFNQRDWWRSL